MALVFGSKSKGIIFCETISDLLDSLRQFYGFIYHTNSRYYIYDRYFGRRYYVLICEMESRYYAILIKDRL